jgi:hypothetical protein
MRFLLTVPRKMTPIVHRFNRLLRANLRLVKTFIALALAIRILIGLIFQ